uniref:Uncharacterized protein n=1 Tax=Oryza glumipatula TaxID=40148 RepID=A0A0E0BF47_9ORYZ
MEARKLLQSCGWAGPYEVRHDAGGHGFFFCWHKRPLYAVTAWRPAASRRGHTRSTKEISADNEQQMNDTYIQETID